MSEYPETILLEEGSEKFDLFKKHSAYFKGLVEGQSEIELSSNLLFGGDQRKWELFVDLFFPEFGISQFASVKNNSIYINPRRGTKKDLKNILNFMMINQPKTMMKFAKNISRGTLNFPLQTVPRGVGISAAVLEKNNNYNNYYNGNSYNNYNTKNNNYSNINIGQTEEEEQLLSKVPRGNLAKLPKYYRRNRNTRRNRNHHRNRNRNTRKAATRRNRK